MANLGLALNEDRVKKTPVGQLRTEYNKLAANYNKMLDHQFLLCPVCGTWKSTSNSFYSDMRYATGVFPECKQCILMEVEQKRSKNDEPRETVESVQHVLQKMDLPYIDSLYKNTVKNVNDNVAEREKSSPFLSYITQIKSLPQYKTKLHWSQSDFGTEENIMDDVVKDTRKNQKIIRDGRKRFGLHYTNEDVFWLENEYQDWVGRYPCDSKAQETLFQILCKQNLEREQARQAGKTTKDIDKSIQDTMNALGIKPSQSKADALADTLTFGQLIDKWEQEKPIPEVEEEFRDVDKIGTYIDVFFKGHLAKMMGLKNAFSILYDKFIAKYTVTKPEVKEEDEEALFNQIFGSEIDEGGD